MITNKFEMFERVKKLWPKETFMISLNSDGVLITDPELWNIYNKIDCDLRSESELIKLSSWAFTQAMEHVGKMKIKEGIRTLFTSDIPFDLFDRKMLSNLSDNSWVGERELYQALPIFSENENRGQTRI